jgi:geranylgeranyl pyrophosphate synthase
VLTRSTFEEFEEYLEAAIDRLAHDPPTRALMREHFGLDDPAAKRGKRLRPRMVVAVAQSDWATQS